MAQNDKYRLRIDRISEDWKRKGLNVVRGLAVHYLRGVVDRTPVRFGVAQAGWNINERVPNTSVPPKGQRVPNNVEAKVAATPVPQSGILVVSNNVEYILPLEGGHSQQAPVGFVGIQLDATMAWYRTAGIFQEALA